MLVREISDPELVNAVKRTLEQSKYPNYVQEILQRLKEYPMYLWGGAVRDSVARCIHKTSNQVRDLDFLVDNSQKELDFKDILKGLPGISHTRFGSPKWRPVHDFEMDIIPFSNALTHVFGVIGEKITPVKAKSVEEVLANTDYTINALAYDLQKNIIYDYGAIKAISSKEMELLLPRDKKQVILSKIILLTDKLDFRIGKKAKEFIIKEYKPGIDKKIKEYLDYKGHSEKYSYVINRLREVSTGSD